jgi:hypothetical protein
VNETSDTASPGPDASPAASPKAGRGRLIAFRVIAILGGLVVAVFAFPAAIGSILSNGVESIHRIHNTSGAMGFGVMLGVSVLLAAWHPERQIAAFQLAIASTVAVVISGLASADLVKAGYLGSVVVLAILSALHPARRRVFSMNGLSVPLAVLAFVTAIPGVAYFLTQTNLQKVGAVMTPNSPHILMHHYSGIAASGIIFLLAGLVTALQAPGWRYALWVTGLTAIVLGAVSVVYPAPDYASALASPWTWLAILWGVVFIAAGEVQSRRAGPLPATASAVA